MSFIFSNYHMDEPDFIDQWENEVWLNKAGEYHREDGPAIIGKDGTEVWYKNNKIHRENGPAAIEPNGTESWWLDGVFIKQSGI